MFDIIGVRPSSSKGYLKVGVKQDATTTYYTMSEGAYRDAGEPRQGDVIDASTLEILKNSDEEYRATISALHSLALADNSASALYAKLVGKGYSPSCAKKTVEQMRSLGYIDEERQLERLIRHLACDKCLGIYKIVPKLMAKGYRGGDVRAVIGRLCADGEIDFEAAKEKLLSSYPDADENEKIKILSKKGFTNV